MRWSELQERLRSLEEERAALIAKLNVTYDLADGWSIRTSTHNQDAKSIFVSYSLFGSNSANPKFPVERKVEQAPDAVQDEYLRIVRELKAFQKNNGPWPSELAQEEPA